MKTIKTVIYLLTPIANIFIIILAGCDLHLRFFRNGLTASIVLSLFLLPFCLISLISDYILNEGKHKKIKGFIFIGIATVVLSIINYSELKFFSVINLTKSIYKTDFLIASLICPLVVTTLSVMFVHLLKKQKIIINDPRKSFYLAFPLIFNVLAIPLIILEQRLTILISGTLIPWCIFINAVLFPVYLLIVNFIVLKNYKNLWGSWLCLLTINITSILIVFLVFPLTIGKTIELDDWGAAFFQASIVLPVIIFTIATLIMYIVKKLKEKRLTK